MKLKPKITKHPYKAKDGLTYVQLEDVPTPIEYRNMVGPLEPYFGVLYNGEVYSKRTQKLLSQHTNKSGYKVFVTRLDGRKSKAICRKVHREVAKAYIPNPDNKPQVNHRNGIKIDNIPTNLEWCTNRENALHAFDNGLVTIKRGVDARTAKFNQRQIDEIRALKNQMSHRDIARKFGVSHSTITRIINEQNYSKPSYYPSANVTSIRTKFNTGSIDDAVSWVRKASGY